MKDLSDACTEIENSLPLWVGGDLEPAAQKEVGDHLARCSRCAEKAATARLSRTRLLEGLDLERRTIGEGPDVWPAIRAALRSEGRLADSRGRPTGMRRMIPMRAAAAAAVLFGLAFAWTRFAPVPPSGVDPISKVPPSPAPVPVLTSSGPTSSAPIPAQPFGLRHLQPGERLLRDSALFYTSEEVPAGRPRFEGSPVGLERTTSVPPR